MKVNLTKLKTKAPVTASRTAASDGKDEMAREGKFGSKRIW